MDASNECLTKDWSVEVIESSINGNDYSSTDDDSVSDICS